jgi:hypothetical protein
MQPVDYIVHAAHPARSTSRLSEHRLHVRCTFICCWCRFRLGRSYITGDLAERLCAHRLYIWCSLLLLLALSGDRLRRDDTDTAARGPTGGGETRSGEVLTATAFRAEDGVLGNLFLTHLTIHGHASTRSRPVPQ